jgi:hypothetical protein
MALRGTHQGEAYIGLPVLANGVGELDRMSGFSGDTTDLISRSTDFLVLVGSVGEVELDKMSSF